MIKRAFSLILIVALCLSISPVGMSWASEDGGVAGDTTAAVPEDTVPAEPDPTAPPTPVPTAPPTAVPEPPAATQPPAEPEVTAEPVVTAEPDPTEQPEITDAPASTETPSVEQTASPEKPAATEAAAPTEKPSALSAKLSTDTRYAYVGEDAIALSLHIGGGAPAYSVTYQITLNGTVVHSETRQAGNANDSFSYVPRAFGVHTLTAVVTDAAGQTARSSVSVPAVVHDTSSFGIQLHKAQSVTLTGDWRKDIVAIAQSQLGYRESEQDYIIRPNGSKQGYTVYGAWYGISHDEWCAMFVSYCANYANISAGNLPRNANCPAMVSALADMGAYHPASSDYVPASGDIIFFEYTGDTRADHVGIVETVTDDAVHTIEGNTSLSVARRTYSRSSGAILGYGSMEALMIRAGLLEEPAELPDSVVYVDAAGKEFTAENVTAVTGGDAAWSDGWYAVHGTVEINTRVNLSGDVNLILTDGGQLTVHGGITVPANSSLTVWGQAEQTGRLTATGSGNASGIGGDAETPIGPVTVNGGNIAATGGPEGGAGIGGGWGSGRAGVLTVTGGTVTAQAGNTQAPAIAAKPAFVGYIHTVCGNDADNTPSDIKVEYAGGPEADWTGLYWVDIRPAEVLDLTVSPEREAVVLDSAEELLINFAASLTVAAPEDGQQTIDDAGALVQWSVDSELSTVEGGQLNVHKDESADTLAVTARANDVTVTAIVSLDREASCYDPAADSVETASGLHFVTGDMTDWTEGWYVVQDDVTIDERITVTGQVNLILADGSCLTARGGIEVTDQNALTIWGQEGQTGRLIASASRDQAAIGSDRHQTCGSITVNGGSITATGGVNSAAIGGREASGTVRINGGVITARTGSNGLPAISTAPEFAEAYLHMTFAGTADRISDMELVECTGCEDADWSWSHVTISPVTITIADPPVEEAILPKEPDLDLIVEGDLEEL